MHMPDSHVRAADFARIRSLRSLENAGRHPSARASIPCCRSSRWWNWAGGWSRASWCARTATPPPPARRSREAPALHPNQRSAAETLAGIAEANAWMSLLNVQADPLYRTLVDEVLDARAARSSSRVDPGMCYRGGWIFVSFARRGHAVPHGPRAQLHPADPWQQEALHLGPDGPRGRSSGTGAGALPRPAFARAVRGTKLSAPGRACSTCSPAWAATCRPPPRTWWRTATSLDHRQLHLLHRRHPPPRTAVSRQCAHAQAWLRTLACRRIRPRATAVKPRCSRAYTEGRAGILRTLGRGVRDNKG